jgi:hypothetical protein
MRKSLVFGGTSTDLLASFSQSDDNQSWCWKTLQTSFEWADPTLLEVLPQSGMTASGRLYQLHNAEHPTSDADGLASRIPAASLTEDGLLPTPTKSGAEHRTRYSQGGRPLMYMIQQGMLPTPTVNEAHNSPYTPSQWDRHGSLNVQAAKMAGLDKQTATTGKHFQLNPLFVEEMMGFPIKWTDVELQHSETQSSHSALNGLDNK